MFADITAEEKQAALDLATAAVTALGDTRDPDAVLAFVLNQADADAPRNALLWAVLILAGLTHDLLRRTNIDRDAFLLAMVQAKL